MRVIPKVSERWDCTGDEIISQIADSGAFEIQMLSNDLSESADTCVKLIKEAKEIVDFNYVIIHLPMKICMIEFIKSHQPTELEFRALLSKLMAVSHICNIKCDILVHIGDDFSIIKMLGVIEYLSDLAVKLESSSVGILLENMIRSVNINDTDKTTLEVIFDHLNSKSINMCLDICHLRASENIFKREISLTDSEINKIKNIHFSYTVDNDGYIDKKRTHGRCHPSLELVQDDLKYLENKGINLENINLVLEINEENYETRPDLVSEIKLFKLISEG